jgi:hypothetical protein
MVPDGCPGPTMSYDALRGTNLVRHGPSRIVGDCDTASILSTQVDKLGRHDVDAPTSFEWWQPSPGRIGRIGRKNTYPLGHGLP